MKTIKNQWKLISIIAVSVMAVFILCVYGIQSSQNRAFALEEQVGLLNPILMFKRNDG